MAVGNVENELKQSTKRNGLWAKGFWFIMQVCALTGFVCLFAWIAFSQMAPLRGIEAEIAVLQNQIAEGEAVKEDLQRQADYAGSDAFMEKMAREKLQMIKPDEIKFIINR